jgi:hypothetical protein
LNHASEAGSLCDSSTLRGPWRLPPWGRYNSIGELPVQWKHAASMTVINPRRRSRERVDSGAAASVPPAAWLFLPAIIPVVFIAAFSSSAPLTDDWALLKAAIAIRGMGLIEAVHTIATLKIYDHHVAVPMLVYLPVSYATHFDARAMMFVTIASGAVQLLIYRRAVGGCDVAALPLALLLFVPSHWMEFMWGIEFTLSLSITFPLVGLLLIDGIERSRRPTMTVAGCVAAISLGIMSSAGAWLGFPAAIVAAIASRLGKRQKAIAIAVLAASALLSYQTLMNHDSPIHPPMLRDAMYLLAALGALIWSSPVAITDITFDFRTATGLTILLVAAISTVEAIRIGRTKELALPLALMTFGCSAIMAIALSRPYLGNWHIQYGIPAVAGAYACCWVALRDRMPRLGLALATVAISSLAIGGFRAFDDYGPAYVGYTRQIESYMLHFDPNAAKPFPLTGGWDFDKAMADFLKAQGSPLLNR